MTNLYDDIPPFRLLYHIIFFEKVNPFDEIIKKK